MVLNEFIISAATSAFRSPANQQMSTRTTTGDNVRAAAGFTTPNGCFLPAIVSPLTPDKQLDEVSLRTLVKFMFSQNVAGLYVGGNTGEGMVMSVGKFTGGCEGGVGSAECEGFVREQHVWSRPGFLEAVSGGVVVTSFDEENNLQEMIMFPHTLSRSHAKTTGRGLC